MRVMKTLEKCGDVYTQKPKEEVMERIENYMIEYNLQPGDRLPSERTLCEQWDCNRITLRSGIQQLIQDGKLYKKNCSGTYVAKGKLLRNLQNVAGFYQTAIADGRPLRTKLINLRKFEADEMISRKMKLPIGHKVWCMERVRYLDEGIPVVLSIIYLDGERFADMENYDLEKEGLYVILKKQYGLEPDCGKQKLSISYCDEKEAKHLEIDRETAVIYQSGITMDKDGTIFEYFQEWNRPDYIYFGSELIRK